MKKLVVLTAAFAFLGLSLGCKETTSTGPPKNTNLKDTDGRTDGMPVPPPLPLNPPKEKP